jgi:hypothetical protein
MFYTLDGAVKVTGLSKSTILRALECGQINGTKDLFGEWRIEHAELCQISRPPAENADKNGTSISTACKAATLEAEIAALVEDAGDSLRGPLSGCHRDTEQVALHRPTANSSETDECSASWPNKIDLRVKEAYLDPHTWDPHIKISDVERISPRDTEGSRRALVTGAILGTLGIGCILLGSVAYFFDRAVSTPVEHGVESSAQFTELKNPATIGSPETDRQATPGLPRTDQIAALAARVPAQRSARHDQQRPATTSSPMGQQNAAASTAASDVERHRKSSSRPMPFPETRPTTIEGWMVRDVVGGTAILQGPDGVWRVTRGDTLPGAGSVMSIVRWGNRWIVATSRGLISTP